MTSDEQKRRFREVLERKNSRAQHGPDHLDGHGKAQRPHGPESHQQQFRRKSV